MKTVLCILAVFALAAGCADPAVIAGLAIYDEITDKDDKSPSSPVIGDWGPLLEPCEFDFGMVSTDPDGFITGFRQTGGEMPPGYSMSLESTDLSSPNVTGRLQGPAVAAGNWTAYFAAVDNDGRESEPREVPFICGNN